MARRMKIFFPPVRTELLLHIKATEELPPVIFPPFVPDEGNECSEVLWR